MGRGAAWWAACVLLACCAATARAQGTSHDEKLGFDEPKGTLRAAYSYVLCQADAIVEPETTADVAAALKMYAAQADAAGKQLKVRLTQRLFHSSAAFPCPAQSRSLVGKGERKAAGVLAVLIVQNKLNKVLEADPDTRTLRVQPGIHLWDLGLAATANNMSIPVGALPVFGGLTLGGSIAAGAHGSGDASVEDTPMDMVQEVVWVDATGARHVATPASPEWRGLYAGLGLVGVMTELVLRLNPPSRTRFKTVFRAADTDMVRDLEKFLKVSPSVLLVWRPDMREYTINMLNEVPDTTPLTDPDLVCTMLADLRYEVPIGALNRDNQGDYRDINFPVMNNVLDYFIDRYTLGRGWAGKPNGSIDTPAEGVGYTNRLQTTAPCGNACTYNGEQFESTAYDTEFTIEWDYLQQWVDDVKAVLQRDMWMDGATKARHLGPGYIWLRVGSERPEYLATQHGMRHPVFLQSTWLRSRMNFQNPMRYGYVLDLIELLGLGRYNGTARPHWGKNTDRTFTDPRYPIRPRYPAFDKLLALQARHDPHKVFEPPLFAKVAAQQAYTHYPGCAMDFQCFCNQDSDCNKPGQPQDFKCMSSAAFPEFKVCKPPADWDPKLISRYGKGPWVKRTSYGGFLNAIQSTLAPLMQNPLTAALLRIGPIGRRRL